MKVRPLHDRLVVRRIEEDEAVKGGIIIPDTAKGEVKLRREGPVQTAEIFALIDSMPMRQKEMGERK